MKNTKTILSGFLIPCLLLACHSESKEIKYIDLTISGDTVELFAPGIISTNLNERDMAISSNGDELFYTMATFNNSSMVLVQVSLDEGKIVHQQIADFSGFNNDIEPFFSPDGYRLYFASDRFTGTGDTQKDYNIWYVEKKETGWSNPLEIGEPVNSENNEFFPSVADNGNIYFTSVREESKGLEDIFFSEYRNGKYSIPVSLDTGVNSKAYEFNAYISPNEDVIVFSSYGRTDDLGGGDLYISGKDNNNNWTKAVNLGNNINSEYLDYCPFIDYTRNIFYFTSNRKEKQDTITNIDKFRHEAESILNGMGNIYRINLNKILKK